EVRYNFLRWLTDQDMQSYWAGVTQFVVDPRTGEATTSDISFNEFAIKDYYVQRIDAFLKYMGASNDINSNGDWPTPADEGTCKDGDTMPIISANRSDWAGRSSL